METNRTRILILTSALALLSATYAEELGLTTFKNARFEPILKAEAGEIILNELGSVGVEEKEALLEDFSVVKLPGNDFFNPHLTRGFYLMGEAAEIRKFVYTEELSEIIIPSSKGDRYLFCTGPTPLNLEGSLGTAATRELRNTHGGLIWRYENIAGYPRTSSDLSLVSILKPGTLNLINAEGENTIIEDGGWKTPFFVTSKGDKIILRNGEAGTVVLDPHGKVLSRLGNNYYSWAPISLTFADAPSFYCSPEFIIRLGRKSNARDDCIQVYNGEALLLWEREFPCQEFEGLRFGLSPNEEFVLICVRRPKRKCELYRVKNGVKIHQIDLLEEDFHWFVECGITNDGRRCFVTTLGGSDARSKAFVFEKGEKIAEFHPVGPEKSVSTYPRVEFSRDGSFIAVAFGKGFTIYRIGKD